MKIAIWGYGWVGKAMKVLFPEAVVYDPALKLGSMELVAGADIAFVAVPTPLIKGTLDSSIVEEVVSKCDANLIIIRSTVMPGTCDHLANKYNKKIVMQPEYLGETINHPMTDQKNRPFIVLGGEPDNRTKAIELYQTTYNANVCIRQVTAYEAEVIKLTENRAIAFKVAQCQELYDVCQKSGVDYYTIRDAVYGDDPRFNLWWTFVFPDNRGFNSKCIPKDVYGWYAWAKSMNYNPQITKAILERNEEWIKKI